MCRAQLISRFHFLNYFQLIVNMSSSFTKFLFLVSLSDQRFFSVINIIQFLNLLSSHEKYQTQKSVVDQLFFRRYAIEEELIFFLEYVVNDQIWSSKVTLNQFIVEWQLFQKLAHQIKKKRNKLMKMKRIIKTRWEFSSFFWWLIEIIIFSVF